jgi:hypothetical protein
MLLDEDASVLQAIGCTGQEEQPPQSLEKRMGERKKGCGCRRGEWTGFDRGWTGWREKKEARAAWSFRVRS